MELHRKHEMEKCDIVTTPMATAKIDADLQECKIVGQILLDYPLSYALTATADVLAVYLQQFRKTVSKVPDTKDTIRFKLDTQDIVYTLDMFRNTLKLPMETLDNTFVAPVNIEIIESFMYTVSYLGVFDKDVIQYPRFIKLLIAYLMKKYPSISLRFKEDYHSIKDDILLVSVYTTWNVTVQGMLIPNAFLTKEICATNDYHDLTLHKTALVAEAQENVAKVQDMLEEDEIKKMVEGEKDKESYAYEDEVKDDDVEKMDAAAEEKDNNDHTDHTLVGTHETGSMETRNEQMQTLISTPAISPRKDLSLSKIISKELTKNVSLTTATTSKDSSKSKSKRGFTSNR
uniref:Uncharacterized protein n=1 Tax=Tanacetum cinerariifolium TaxID=118510 RepID=A0A6L2LGQ9_TANCI|nr:hypothetical protein [Tanacetum cinerariifolium]